MVKQMKIRVKGKPNVERLEQVLKQVAYEIYILDKSRKREIV